MHQTGFETVHAVNLLHSLLQMKERALYSLSTMHSVNSRGRLHTDSKADKQLI